MANPYRAMNYPQNEKLLSQMLDLRQQIRTLKKKHTRAINGAEGAAALWITRGFEKGFRKDAERYTKALECRQRQYSALMLQMLHEAKPPVQKPAPVWAGNRLTSKSVTA